MSGERDISDKAVGSNKAAGPDRAARLVLVLGGARSGKSRYAESLIPGEALYIATATASDEEMRVRIAAHRARRSARWEVIEEPLELAACLARHARPGRPVLVDCLTLWLANTMLAGSSPETGRALLVSALRAAPAPVVLVSNEVGLGIVPATPLGRAFRDEAGRLNQEIADMADRVVFVAAGLPLVLKGAAD